MVEDQEPKRMSQFNAATGVCYHKLVTPAKPFLPALRLLNY